MAAPHRYNAVWRWHFYAGLFCIPFVIWLSLTGAIYLWRPQIEAWLDRPYRHLATAGPIAAPGAQAAAALRAVPGAALRKYVMPDHADAAVRLIVRRADTDWRVMVDPRSLAILDVRREEWRPLRLILHLHGELMAGAAGSYLIEIASCWAIVMLLTGLYLWWPRRRAGLAGVLYPRLRAGGRVFWRDLHATSGIWVSLFALGLIVTGLPWAKAWGGYLAEVRVLTGTAQGPVDWTIGGKAPAAPAMGHDGHGGMAMPAAPLRAGELDRVAAVAPALRFAPPVVIAPPGAAGGAWSIVSDAANRPLRAEAKVDGASGAILAATPFARRHWIDRAVGYGVAVHEGALFGLANQLLGTATALLLVLLSGSGAVMWWRRRPVGLLGAPRPAGGPRAGVALVAAVVALAVYLPLFGLTLLLVLAFERIAARRLPGVARWLALRPRAA